MKKNTSFTEGKILQPLILFAFPVLLALFLQAMYGAVDLLIVGKFASSADVSAVSTGSQIMSTLTNLISSFAMGTTILLGQQIGSGKREEGGHTVGTAILMFAIIAVVMSIIMVIFAPGISRMMNAPEEAFQKTVDYIRICGGGMLVIVAYNLIGCIFRGLGDSNTPLITVAIACVFNIAGDLLLCAVFHLGTAGAAIATVFAQAISVVASLLFISKKELPFVLKSKNIRIHKAYLCKMVGFGAPIALQDLLVSISFLIILAIVNAMGVIASAGVGVAEKVCAFIMLISSAFMQSMSAFVAQNYGAGHMHRAKKALHYGILVSFSVGVVMFVITFFHGNVLAGIFSSDKEVILAAADYLKAYAIDCLFTAIFFCYTGFYNGIGKTRFVMVQGIIGAFCVRVPVSYIMSIQARPSLFHIGLATPMSSVLQLILCVGFMLVLQKKGVLEDRN
ncbi:MAG: MATE family efflux transporter [Clostridia bacterium]|nr:MATE family efflux transporter [Clostridia bacterium]